MTSHLCGRLNRFAVRIILPGLSAALALLAMLSALSSKSQILTTSPDAQRNALTAVRAEAGSLHNVTQNAVNYGDNGYSMVLNQFQVFRGQYNAFTATLSQNQVDEYANEWAELNAGLDIIQEAFGNYQNDLADGRSATTALRDLCQVVDQAGRVWMQEFNTVASQAHAGW